MAADTDPLTPPRVIIANINRGQISAQTTFGMIQSLHSGVAMTVLMAESGPYLDVGRNKAVANCLTVPEWNWLLFIDSDIEFTPDHITALLAPTLHPDYDELVMPVIGGVYHSVFDDKGVAGETPGDPGYVGPVVFEWTEIDDYPGVLAGIPTESFRRISRGGLAALPSHSVDFPHLARVACIGTGFLAIHRSLLDSMARIFPEPDPWFVEPVVNGVHLGEDMGFCHRLNRLGYPVLANRACVVQHLKTVKLI